MPQDIFFRTTLLYLNFSVLGNGINLSNLTTKMVMVFLSSSFFSAFHYQLFLDETALQRYTQTITAAMNFYCYCDYSSASAIRKGNRRHDRGVPKTEERSKSSVQRTSKGRPTAFAFKPRKSSSSSTKPRAE